jgi:glycosyltransferase involved in cell wall biosynthesis
VDESSFFPRSELDAAVESKAQNLSKPLRLVFFGRLVPSKGPDVFVKACHLLAKEGIQVHADIYGDGYFRDELEELARGLESTLHFRGSIQYGEAFFRILASYHALVLPNRSDEQPRIIFDGFSQGVPILASLAPGLDLVRDGESGLRFNSGDAEDLVRVVKMLSEDPALFKKVSHGAYEAGKGYSHIDMHRKRSIILMSAFPNSRQLKPFESST